MRQSQDLISVFALTTLVLLCGYGWGEVLQENPQGFRESFQILALHKDSCDGALRLSGAGRVEGLLGDYEVPYEERVLAIPKGSRPVVSLSVSSWKPLGGELSRIGQCGEDKNRAELVSTSGRNPLPRLEQFYYEREGVSLMRVRIPLVVRRSGQWMVVQKGEWSVDYQSQTRQTGIPSSRVLSRVVNPRAARYFGARPVSTRRLARQTFPLNDDVEWLARFWIGDRELAQMQEDGWYAISYEDLYSVLQTAGLESQMQGVAIERLALWGGRPDTLPEVPQSSEATWGDLVEFPLQVVDSRGNGIWDAGDTLRFFATGTSFWKRYDTQGRDLKPDSVDYYFSTSPHSFVRALYLGIHTSKQGKRLDTLETPGHGASLRLKNYVRAEEDVYVRDNCFGKSGNSWESHSGIEWFWFWIENKSEHVQISSFQLTSPAIRDLPGVKSSDSAWVQVGFFPHRTLMETDEYQSRNEYYSRKSYEDRMQWIDFRLTVNGTVVDPPQLVSANHFLLRVPPLSVYGNSYSMDVLPNGRQPDRLDGLTITYPWNPVLNDSGTWILPGKAVGAVRVDIAQLTSDYRIFKWTDDFLQGEILPDKGFFTDSIVSGSDTRYWIGKTTVVRKLDSIEVIVPQQDGILNMTDLNDVNPQYIIVSANELATGARVLSQFRQSTESLNPMRTEVVLMSDLVMYFGGGQSSPQAVRNFLRMGRQLWPHLEAVLLVGDGHLDSRRLYPSSPPVFVPVFEQEDMASDDYYALLDSGEQLRYGIYDRDLYVGRLPFNQSSELSAYYQKILDYEKVGRMDQGNWRNTIILSADDNLQGTTVDGLRHTEQQEDLATSLDSLSLNRGFQIDMHKIYLVAYERNLAMKKPEATKDLITRMNQGALFTFYFGHGAATDWADEGLLTSNQIVNLDNRYRNTILGSFACTVGRFDQPDLKSLSELFLQNSEMGAIASLGAMRESYSGPNTTLARLILEEALIRGASSLGEALFNAKGSAVTTFNENRYNGEKYVLLGEPVLPMPSPQLKVVLDQQIDTLQALQKVTLSGSVSGIEAGSVYLQMLEGSKMKVYSQDVGTDKPFSYNVVIPGNLIHAEEVTVEQGRFVTDFITPRKIAFGDTTAQIRLWAQDEQGKTGRSLLSNIVIHGMSTYADSLQDQTPPLIRFRPCNQTDSLARYFHTGRSVQMQIPACVDVLIEDSTGIDMREQPDEGISFAVEGYEDPWHPSSWIEQSGKRVLVRMNFTDKWNAGNYLFRVKAQDLLGNVRDTSLSLELEPELSNALSEVFNAPNPMGDHGTTFYFSNLAENNQSQVVIQIFSARGKLVKVLRNARSGVTHWDGRDRWNRKLANGLYHYVVTCTVFSSEEDASPVVFRKKQKLVISR